jgi:hypothetical protein
MMIDDINETGPSIFYQKDIVDIVGTVPGRYLILADLIDFSEAGVYPREEIKRGC